MISNYVRYSQVILKMAALLLNFIQHQLTKTTMSSKDRKPKQQQKEKKIPPVTSVKHSLLQMTEPYYHYSLLYNSMFSGYYGFFLIYSLYFIMVFPILKFMKEGTIIELAVVKITETNLLWDIVSLTFFLIVSTFFMSIGKPQSRSHKLMILIYILLFVGAGYWVVDSFDMYFTDRIFIVVMSWNFCFKMISYELDCGKEQQNLGKKTLLFKFKFLICPIVSYSEFEKEHDPTLPINKLYLLKKGATSFFCIFAVNILMIEFMDPLINSAGELSFVALFFKLIPYTFYMNIILYYMVMENVVNAVSEITKIRNRVFYEDWWNAVTVHEYLEKWTVLMNKFTRNHFPRLSRQATATVHVSILLVLLLQVFGRGVNLESVLFFGFVTSVVYFLGGVKALQNNYIVHLLTIGFTPLLIAVHAKYKIFAETSFWTSI